MKHAVIAAAAVFVLAGCQKTEAPVAPPAAITQSDAEIIVNRDEVEAASMDAARIKALYAPDIVAFDAMTMPLATDRATFDKLQDAFAAMKFDSIERKERKIQVLDPDTFVVSGTSDFASTKIAGKRVTVRYTQVYEKQGDGKWLIVNEHASLVK